MKASFKVIDVVNLLNQDSVDSFVASAASRNKDFANRQATSDKLIAKINDWTDLNGLNAIVLVRCAFVDGDNDNQDIKARACRTLTLKNDDGSWAQCSPFAVHADNESDAIAEIQNMSDVIVLLREPDVLTLSRTLGLATGDAFNAAHNIEMLANNGELTIDYTFVSKGSRSYMKDGVVTTNEKNHWRIDPQAIVPANTALHMAMIQARAANGNRRVRGMVTNTVTNSQSNTVVNVDDAHIAYINRNKANFKSNANQAKLLQTLKDANCQTDADRALALAQFVKAGATL